MYNLITILGPTATGKTSLAALLASKVNGEVISADSRQVYKGMDIGTGKDLEDYMVNGNQIPYHLIDIADPGYEFNVFEFKQLFYQAYRDITARNKNAILCGGTGMYIDAILRNYQLDRVTENKALRTKLEKLNQTELVTILNELGSLHNTTDTLDRERTIRAIEIETHKRKEKENSDKYQQLNPLTIGINHERSVTRERITARLKQRLENGMIEEVQGLLNNGLTPGQLIFYGLEYKFLTLYLTGEMTYDEMFEKLNIAIHQFAKRQMTWFRRMEKKAVKIHWIDGKKPNEEKADIILSLMNA